MSTYSWPKDRKVLGTDVPRVDGALKTSGRAKYSYDINRPGMLHAVMVGSKHAHATIKRIDTSAAEGMEGVKGIYPVKKVGDEVQFAGEPILAIAAETEAKAHDAARAVKIDYAVLPHVVKEELAKAHDAPKVTEKNENTIGPRDSTEGDFDSVYNNPRVVRAEGTYSLPAISHMCWEAHGSVAEWNGDKLTVWSSTQATQGIAQALAREFNTDVANVQCITHFMGGGFGSKFAPGVEGLAAAHLAKTTGRPVKLMLTRRDEHSAGIRPSSSGTVKIAATKEGKIVAVSGTTQASPGVGGSARVLIPYVYKEIPNQKSSFLVVRLNHHETRAYRAPGHPQSCYIMEAAMDDLAAKLEMDPLELRKKNLPGGLVGQIYQRELEIGADLFKWKEKYHPPGAGKGPIKRGVGMALHEWGGGGRPQTQMTVEINADGSVLVQSSTQDLGTANRTVLAVVAAEVLGLKPEQITTQIGESQWATSFGSGGSTTCPSTAPATLIAVTDARTKLFEKIAPAFGTGPENLVAVDGKIKGGGKEMTWKEAVRKLGMEKVSVLGEYTGALFATAGLSSTGVGGCQFAEVEVDEETGQVRCIEVVAVQDCGLIVNKLACESQVAGGVIMALNAALYEERVMDQETGWLLNGDVEFYKLGTISNMPKIKVHMFDDEISQSRGVIGIGEPPTISTAAAIGNAVFNALGVRVPDLPLTPRNVLTAIANAKGGVA